MAYPIIPDVCRVQVRMYKATGLPTDVFINNLYFETSANDTVATDATTIAGMIDAFYGGTFAPEPGSLAERMPDFITDVRYYFYDLGQPTPRYPVVPDGQQDDFITANWVGQLSASEPLPEEVALCCSFSSGNGPRRRGRIYIGPVTIQNNEVADGGARPDITLRRRIALAAYDLSNSTENPTWVQVSPTAGDYAPVNAGWVDNAWDTQRSRGAVPTDRLTWADGSPPA